MRVIRVLALEGPNVWSRQRVLEMELELDETSPGSRADAVRRLVGWWDAAQVTLPASDVASLPWPDSPRDSAEVLLALMLNLQRDARWPVGEGFVCREDETGTAVRLIAESVEVVVGRRAFELACELWEAAQHDTIIDLTARLQEFRAFSFEVCLGQTTGAIVIAAQARGIPVLRLDDESLVQLGHGARQRRVQTAITDRSGCIAEAVSRDKVLTKQLLKRLGIPVPEGRLVGDAEAAWTAACEVGLPVVVKPRDADYGQGVSLKLMSCAEITAAFAEAHAFSAEVIVERFLEGAHHRLLVVGGRVIAAVRFERAVIIGDGERTVAELIEEMNRDPRRGARNDRTRPWFWMEVDDETRRVLASQGSGLEMTPRPGERVVLRFEPRIGWGGGVIDVTDDVHPDVAASVTDAVAMVGLDIAGVDLVANNIARPLTEQNGGLLEVNAGPAILMHLSPFSDPPRPVPEAIISLMFPQPEQSRIPLVAICGDDECSTVTCRVEKLLATMHSVVGRATRAGVFVDERRVRCEPSDNATGIRTLLLHPRVEAAVCEVSLDRLREEGLAFDESRVAIVMSLDNTNPTRQRGRTLPRALLRNESRERSPSLARRVSVDCDDQETDAICVLIDSALPHGTVILNVDDPQVADLATDCGRGAIVISTETSHLTVARVRQSGGRAVFLRGAGLVLAHGSREFPLLPLGTLHDGAMANGSLASTTSLLAIVAVGWALGITPELLRRELSRAA